MQHSDECLSSASIVPASIMSLCAVRIYTLQGYHICLTRSCFHKTVLTDIHYLLSFLVLYEIISILYSFRGIMARPTGLQTDCLVHEESLEILAIPGSAAARAGSGFSQ